MRKDGCVEHGDGTVAALKCKSEVLRVAGLFGQRPVSAVPELGRDKLRIENRPELWGNIELISDI